MGSKATGYTVHAYSASGALLGLTGPESAGKFAECPDGQAAGQLLFSKSGHRRADDGRAVRNTVRWFIVTAPDGRQTAHGRPRGSLVMYVGMSEGEREAFDVHAKHTGKPVPWDIHRGPTGHEPVSAPQTAAEPVKVPAPRKAPAEPVSIPSQRPVPAESATAGRVTVRTGNGSGAHPVNATTVERLTVGSDNPKGEPVYVKRLPERHSSHGGKTVRDVFGHDGYWFTVPGEFPASLPDEFAITRQTFAVFQSPDVVRGALVWVVHHLWGRHGVQRGTSTESRRLAVRAAVADYSRWAMNRAAEIIENRAAINSEPAPALVRVTAEGGAWVAHVKCAHGALSGAESFDSIESACTEWLDADPGTPWDLCAHSPRSFVTGGSGERYTVTGTGRGDGVKTPAGFAVLHGMHDDGRTASVILRRTDTRRL